MAARFPCPEPDCDKTYANPDALAKHVKEKHRADIAQAGRHQCEQCPRSYAAHDGLLRHIRAKHPEAVVNDAPEPEHQCDHCDKAFQNPGALTRHMRQKHPEHAYLHSCYACEFYTTVKAELDAHLLIHGPVSNKYKCKDCNVQYKNARGLNQHMRGAPHYSKGKPFKCPEEGCDAAFAFKKTLGEHLASAAHKKGEMFYCECGYAASSPSNLKAHKARHHSNDKNHACEGVNDDGTPCTYTAVTKGEVRRHFVRIHTNIRPVPCDVVLENGELCDAAFPEKWQLARHKEEAHNINIDWKQCPLCDVETKRTDNLRSHMKHVHDMGDNLCDFCAKMAFSCNEYTDHVGTHNICKECYYYITGKVSRVEHIWSDHIDRVLGTDYLTSSDKSLRSLGGCQLYRPDKLYVGLKTVHIYECDEHQHSGVNYECDERRLSEIYDEPAIAGKSLVVIRWNPDNYKTPDGGPKKTREERLAMMCDLANLLRARRPADKIHVYYMFYDQGTDRISQNLPHTFIYQPEDIAALGGTAAPNNYAVRPEDLEESSGAGGSDAAGPSGT